MPVFLFSFNGSLKEVTGEQKKDWKDNQGVLTGQEYGLLWGAFVIWSSFLVRRLLIDRVWRVQRYADR